MTDSKVDKWLRWFEASIFLSYFFEYIEDTYAVTQSVAVRRQAECSSRVKTLGRLIYEVEQDAERITRDFWIGLWTNEDMVRDGLADRAWSKQWADDEGKHLAPAIPARDFERLTTGGEKVADYVDQYLAHSDARPKAGLPTFADLDAAIDLLGELYAKYGNLLTAAVYPLLVPAIDHGWLAVFQRPWIAPGWERASD